MVPAFPLTWPEGLPRSKSRETGSFKTTLAGAISNVQGSLRRFATNSGKHRIVRALVPLLGPALADLIAQTIPLALGADAAPSPTRQPDPEGGLSAYE